MSNSSTERPAALSRIKPALEMMLIILMIAVCVVVLYQAVNPRIGVTSPPAASAGNSRVPAGPRVEPPLPSEPLSLQHAPVKGSTAARVVIVQFSDFHCPFCARFTEQTLPALDEKYFSKGIAQMAFRHFPLDSLHPQAFRASEFARCAQQQGRFWEMHDLLFQHPKTFAGEEVQRRAVGLLDDEAAFNSCVNGKANLFVKADRLMGETLGVTGTPTFFVGLKRDDGRVHVKERLSGAAPLMRFVAAIEKLAGAK